MNIQQCKEQLKLLQEQIKTLEVKSVFPILGKTTRVLIANGDILGLCGSIGQAAKQGNTFYTAKTALKERDRRAAKTRILETINLLNKGDNGFKPGEDNFFIEYNHGSRFQITEYRFYQSVPASFYLRKENLQLLENKSFLEDYKLFLEI